MAERTDAALHAPPLGIQVEAHRVAVRAVLDLSALAFVHILLVASDVIAPSTALTFAAGWLGMAVLLGAYEVEYRMGVADTLAGGLLIALPAAAATSLLVQSPWGLVLAALLPLRLVTAAGASARLPMIDHLAAPIGEPPPATVPSRWTAARIRAWDVVGAALGLLVAAPLMLLVWVADLGWARGPLTFRQDRVGQYGRTFSVLKCRTMVVGADADGAQWAVPDDPRITVVGRILRRSRIDELPQLWNVLTGEMSIVGPRPEQVPLVDALRADYPHYASRYLVRPGLTGLSQVCVGYTATVEEAAQKLSRDLYYVAHPGTGLNFAISARTVRTVLAMAGR
ncbi:MAG: sugar transferase [Dehalococcoidia bacterium]